MSKEEDQQAAEREKTEQKVAKKNQEAGIPAYCVSTPPPSLPPSAVSAPSAPSAPAIAPKEKALPRKVAVFVAHGMGQPIPFQTLDAVAERLRDYDSKMGVANSDPAERWKTPQPVSRAVKFEDRWLQRIELQLKGAEGTPNRIEAHVYEAYWAPLTEGRINIGQVIAFLAGAGRNGLKNWSGKFQRWLFNSYMPFPIPTATVLSLIVALAAVWSLVIMNSAIAVVVAGRALLATSPEWLTNNLFVDLTTTFNMVVTTMLVFAIVLAVAHLTRRLKVWRWLRTIWTGLTLISFLTAITVVILAGVAIVLLFVGHVRSVPSAPLWNSFVPEAAIKRFNSGFDSSVLVVAGFVVSILGLSWALRILSGLWHDVSRRSGQGLALGAGIFFTLLTIAVIWLTARLVGVIQAEGGGGSVASIGHSLAWPLLVAASAYIRLVLVQFVGDVAIYVMPYKLDAFNDLRKEIKDLVYNVARAVYSLKSQPTEPPDYSSVIVVGHSLGSVIAYDALNRLILEDEASSKALGVVSRTPLLLTFGSPLDKTAYIFAVQGSGTTEARESVAAAVQPLIQDDKFRPKRWVNVYSHSDIISGSLDFYDIPNSGKALPPGAPAPNVNRVDNKIDPDATTLLIAHTEYWSDDAVVHEIYDSL
jgi:hypothetical protein